MSLERMREKSVADMIVCSATPQQALQKEWAEHNIHGHVAVICGQEVGKARFQISGEMPHDDGNRIPIAGTRLREFIIADLTNSAFAEGFVQILRIRLERAHCFLPVREGAIALLNQR